MDAASSPTTARRARTSTAMREVAGRRRPLRPRRAHVERVGFYLNFERALSMVPPTVPLRGPRRSGRRLASATSSSRRATSLDADPDVQLVASDVRVIDREGRVLAADVLRAPGADPRRPVQPLPRQQPHRRVDGLPPQPARRRPAVPPGVRAPLPRPLAGPRRARRRQGRVRRRAAPRLRPARCQRRSASSGDRGAARRRSSRLALRRWPERSPAPRRRGATTSSTSRSRRRSRRSCSVRGVRRAARPTLVDAARRRSMAVSSASSPRSASTTSASGGRAARAARTSSSPCSPAARGRWTTDRGPSDDTTQQHDRTEAGAPVAPRLLPAAVPSDPGERRVVGPGVHRVAQRRPRPQPLPEPPPAEHPRRARLLRPAHAGGPGGAGGAGRGVRHHGLLLLPLLVQRATHPRDALQRGAAIRDARTSRSASAGPTSRGRATGTEAPASC